MALAVLTIKHMRTAAWLLPLAIAQVACRDVTPARASAPAPVVAAPAPKIACPAVGCVTRPAIADHVIIVSQDGLRPDALLQAKAPAHAALMREGAYSLRAKTIRQASTLPSHAAMLSGFDVAAHGLSWNSWRPERGFIKVPTVFTAALGAGKEAAAFVGKRKLEHIAHPGTVTVFSRPGFFCKKVAEQAAAHFLEKRPQVEFIHFSDPDEGGHRAGWMSHEQLEAVGHADRCLSTLIAAVKGSGALDRTLLILSADHGGRGRNHSGATQDDRLIPWIAWGAGVRRGHRLRTQIVTVDTAATALWALGHAAPDGGLGRPVMEAFRETDQ